MKRHCANMTREEKEGVAAKLKQIAGTANYRAVTDEATLRTISLLPTFFPFAS